MKNLKNLISDSERVQRGKSSDKQDYRNHEYAKKIDKAMQAVINELDTLSNES